MSEYNCQALKSMTVSDDFRQRLLSIPDIADFNTKSTVVIPVRYLAVAASMVLAFAMSISAFFFFGNKPAPIVSAVLVRETANQTESKSEAETETASPTAPSAAQSPTENPAQPPTQISTDSEGNILIITITDIITQEEEEPSEQGAPAQPEREKDLPAEPTENVPHPATEAPQPVTEKPYIATPTENSPNPAEPAGGSVCYADIPLSSLDGSENIYCAMFNCYGSLLGDEDAFSAGHLAVRERESDGYVTFLYDPSDYGIYVAPGLYDIYFYDESGNILYHSSVNFY